MTIRHQSPSATGGPASAKSISDCGLTPLPKPRPPERPFCGPMNISTQAAISAYVTNGVRVRHRRRPAHLRLLLPMHSGQRCPTGVAVMHSGQIGRPQFEQASAVSRSGCR